VVQSDVQGGFLITKAIAFGLEGEPSVRERMGGTTTEGMGYAACVGTSTLYESNRPSSHRRQEMQSLSFKADARCSERMLGLVHSITTSRFGIMILETMTEKT
jgi:hypothetical protein